MLLIGKLECDVPVCGSLEHTTSQGANNSVAKVVPGFAVLEGIPAEGCRRLGIASHTVAGYVDSTQTPFGRGDAEYARQL